MGARASITIVGAGPAGLCAGLNLISCGYKPTIYEKNTEITSSLCAEAVDTFTLSKLKDDTGFDSSRYISRRVDRGKLIFPNGCWSLVFRDIAVLNRTSWLRGMADAFVKAGGILNLGTIWSTDTISKFLKRNNGEKYLINASGPFGPGHTYTHKFTVCQYKLRCDIAPYKHIEFYFDKDYTMHYAWVFPKLHTLNVGLSGNFRALDKFRTAKKIHGKLILRGASIIPVGGTKFKKGKHIFYVGDSAGMAGASNGGGLYPIVLAAHILAECISSGKLHDYERRIISVLKPQAQLRALRIFETFTNHDLNILGKYLHEKDLFQLDASTKYKLKTYEPILYRKFNIFLDSFTGSKLLSAP
jgi:flavin-dependent dehydrogenase